MIVHLLIHVMVCMSMFKVNVMSDLSISLDIVKFPFKCNSTPFSKHDESIDGRGVNGCYWYP